MDDSAYNSLVNQSGIQTSIQMNIVLPQNLAPFIWHFLKPYKRTVVIYTCLTPIFSANTNPLSSPRTPRPPMQLFQTRLDADE